MSTTYTTGCYLPDGYAAEPGDCDDTDPSVNPGADEVCDDEIDNDCDNLYDDQDPDAEKERWYEDGDGDGYGTSSTLEQSCGPPDKSADWVLYSGDCDDGDATVYPDAPETCDGIDSDCDDLVDGQDPDVTDEQTWYYDADDDGYGDPDESYEACSQHEGYVLDGSDCDDGDSAAYPGAPEVCGDGVDQDCDGSDAVCIR